MAKKAKKGQKPAGETRKPISLMEKINAAEAQADSLRQAAQAQASTDLITAQDELAQEIAELKARYTEAARLTDEKQHARLEKAAAQSNEAFDKALAAEARRLEKQCAAAAKLIAAAVEQDL